MNSRKKRDSPDVGVVISLTVMAGLFLISLIISLLAVRPEMCRAAPEWRVVVLEYLPLVLLAGGAVAGFIAVTRYLK